MMADIGDVSYNEVHTCRARLHVSQLPVFSAWTAAQIDRLDLST
jgi:hypothetical protein